MVMATYVLSAILLVLFALALRHVYRNFSSGKHDCCGCDICSETHKGNAPKANKAEEACCCCSSHK